MTNTLLESSLKESIKFDKYSSYGKIICHEGYKEIYEGIYLSSYPDSYKMAIEKKPDILVPLERMSAEILHYWSGEVYYLPIEDFSILPIEWEIKAIDYLMEKHAQGKTIGIFCQGGHGRTGYIAGLLLSKLGIIDPIEFIRKHYCKQTIESNAQINSIIRVSGNVDLKKYKTAEYKYSNRKITRTHYPITRDDYEDSRYHDYDSYDDYYTKLPSYVYDKESDKKLGTCYNCVENIGGWCDLHQKGIILPIQQCEDFEDINDYIEKFEKGEQVK